MKLFLTPIIIIITASIAKAQLPLKGDTVLYTKVDKPLEQLLPKEISFFTNTTKIAAVKKVFDKAIYTSVNNNQNYTLQFTSKTDAKLLYTLGGNTSDEVIEFIRLGTTTATFTKLLPQIGKKTVTDKDADYWFLQTNDGYKFFVIVNKMGEACTISLGIKPKTWVHLLKK